MYVLIDSTLSGHNACYFWYNQPSNVLFMENSTGTGWQGPVTPGSAATLSNAQCSVDVPGITVSGSGNTLTLSLPVTANTFAGTQNVYLFVYDSERSGSGWTHEGAWTWTP